MNRVYQIITDRIIALLEQGTVPWHRPWGGPDGIPKNLASGKEYRGINVFMLSSAGYESPYWLSYKQAKNRDGHVKKGEKGWPVVYWNWIERGNPDIGEPLEKRPFLKYYTVFNVEQCDNVPYPETRRPENDFSSIKACKEVVSRMPRLPTIEHKLNRAFYRPAQDLVNMPKSEWFESSEEYYSTLFHELVHSTGHESRLARVGISGTVVFGSRLYSREELIAEMGAAYLCGHTGIENKTIENSAGYIEGWVGRLRKNNKLVVQAGAQAQKAADYILNKNWYDADVEERQEVGNE